MPACDRRRVAMAPAACCGALEQPIGCSLEWADDFALHSVRARDAMRQLAGYQCAASWPCLFPTQIGRRDTPCFDSTCTDVFEPQGALTPQCAAVVAVYCARNDTDADARQTCALIAASRCDAQPLDWRRCLHYQNNKATVGETTTAKMRGLATTVQAGLTLAEYQHRSVAGCSPINQGQADASQRRCPQHIMFYDTRGGQTPFVARAAVFTVWPNQALVVDYYNVLTVVVLAVAFIVNHFHAVFVARTKRDVCIPCV